MHGGGSPKAAVAGAASNGAFEPTGGSSPKELDSTPFSVAPSSKLSAAAREVSEAASIAAGDSLSPQHYNGSRDVVLRKEFLRTREFKAGEFCPSLRAL
jgi:hypothetical protein